MNLRKELEHSEGSLEFRKMLKTKIEKIETLIENKLDCTNEIEEFNKTTQRDYNEIFFRSYWNAMSIEEVIDEACNPSPKKIKDITKDELVEIVRRILDVEKYGSQTSFYLELLEVNVAMPEVSDLIFHSKEELTPEEIIERTMEYKKICL